MAKLIEIRIAITSDIDVLRDLWGDFEDFFIHYENSNCCRWYKIQKEKISEIKWGIWGQNEIEKRFYNPIEGKYDYLEHDEWSLHCSIWKF